MQGWNDSGLGLPTRNPSANETFPFSLVEDKMCRCCIVLAECVVNESGRFRQLSNTEKLADLLRKGGARLESVRVAKSARLPWRRC